MRLRLIVILIVLIAALLVCAFLALRSKKKLSNNVAALLLAIVPPMLGNCLIIASISELVSVIGMYIYFIGMDVMVIALIWFSVRYCNLGDRARRGVILATLLTDVDIIQILLNPVLGLTFTTRTVMVEGLPYYAVDPLIGQTFHRVIVYGIFLAALVTFAYKCATASRFNVERYAVILATMIFGGAWQTFYIFSGTPIDQSMIAFGVFGLLVYYFALHYKPFRLLDRMLSRVVEGTPSSVFFFERDGKCIYANARGRAFLGLDPSSDLPEDVGWLLETKLQTKGKASRSDWSQMRHVRAPGTDDERFYEIQAQQVKDDRGAQAGTAYMIRDVTESERRLQSERHLANHDALTDLYNQAYLYRRTSEIVAENPDVSYIVGGMDVKDFKLVNDIFSKEFGDRVLCAIGDRMREVAKITPSAVYGRLSSDKFGFIVRADEFNAEHMEAHMRNFSFTDMDMNHPIVVHTGFYEVVERDLPASVMYDRAFMALASIKNDLNRRVAVYDNTMRESALWSQTISSQLEGAIADGQIRPYLQPMVDADGVIEGAEVLVRWIHPEEGFLSPARFIPVFEENGMIAQLDLFMWERACQILQDWQRRGIDLFLSVNISPKDFYFIDVLAEIRGLVEKYGIDPAKLRLEITETVMMSDLENRLRILENLREYGFMVEMDDFGSGYSSLNMLKDIPVDVLKIDMMFLYKTKDQGKAQTILQTIINLSGQLGIPSITEGVETAEQLSMLVSMGCKMFQGYYFAKPMPLEDFEELVAA